LKSQIQNETKGIQLEYLQSGTLLNKDDWIYFTFNVFTSAFAVQVIGSHTNFYLKKGMVFKLRGSFQLETRIIANGYGFYQVYIWN
jgi:hypothetical protein